MTDIIEIDHVKNNESLLASQYQNSSNLKAYVKLSSTQANELEKAYLDLLNKRHLGEAKAEQLNVLGRIVGVDRTIVDGEKLKFFTIDDPNAPIGPSSDFGFGLEGSPWIGGQLIGEGQSPTGDIELSDAQYELFIRAKILKNHSSATMDEFINMYTLIFQSKVKITDAPGALYVYVGRPLSAFEKLLFKVVDQFGRYLLPKPLGIRLFGFTYDPDNYFGFEADPNAKGFNLGKLAGEI